MIKNNLILIIMLCSFDFPIRTSGQQSSNAQLALDQIFSNPKEAFGYIAKCTKDDLNCKLHPYFDKESELITIKGALDLYKNTSPSYEELYQKASVYINKLESKEKPQSGFCIIS